MKSFTILSGFTGLIVLASAAPAVVPVSKKREAVVSVYLCTDRYFKGYCVDIPSPSGTCVPLGPDLNDQVSSVGPDGSAFCYFFVNDNCDIGGGVFHVGSPGYADLSITPVNGPPGSRKDYEDKISSYRCTS